MTRTFHQRATTDRFISPRFTRPFSERYFHPLRFLSPTRVSHRTQRKSPTTSRRFDSNSITASGSPSKSMSAVTAALRSRLVAIAASRMKKNPKRSLSQKKITFKEFIIYHTEIVTRDSFILDKLKYNSLK